MATRPRDFSRRTAALTAGCGTAAGMAYGTALAAWSADLLCAKVTACGNT